MSTRLRAQRILMKVLPRFHPLLGLVLVSEGTAILSLSSACPRSIGMTLPTHRSHFGGYGGVFTGQGDRG